MGSFAMQFPIRLGMTDTAQKMYEWLAPFFREDEIYSFSGMKMVKGFSKMLDPVAEIVNPLGLKAPFALIFEPKEQPIAWVEWLAQFVGADLTEAKTEEVKREWVEKPINWKRGDAVAIRQAVANTLTGSKIVYFYPRFNNEAFVLKVAVNETECPNEKETIVAAEALLPAWIKLEFARVKGGTYAQFEALHEKYSEQEAKDATYEIAEINPT